MENEAQSCLVWYDHKTTSYTSNICLIKKILITNQINTDWKLLLWIEHEIYGHALKAYHKNCKVSKRNKVWRMSLVFSARSNLMKFTRKTDGCSRLACGRRRYDVFFLSNTQISSEFCCFHVFSLNLTKVRRALRKSRLTRVHDWEEILQRVTRPYQWSLKLNPRCGVLPCNIISDNEH